MKEDRPAEAGPGHGPLTEPRVSDRLLTVPNLLCMVRLVGSFFLLPLAWRGDGQLFLWGFLLLALTDWLDGKLAILLDQRSVFGARLDSWADAALYAALFFGLVTLHGQTLADELSWMLLGLTTYLLSTLAGFVKYRRWPSYHTRAAKITWFITAVAVVSLFSDWSILPVRIAAVMVVLTNAEALAITWISPAWRADVPSIFHAWRAARNP